MSFILRTKPKCQHVQIQPVLSVPSPARQVLLSLFTRIDSNFQGHPHLSKHVGDNRPPGEI
jgi:hypothetical protein